MALGQPAETLLVDVGENYIFASIAFWASERVVQDHSRDQVSDPASAAVAEFIEDVDLPVIEEVDAWEAIEDLEIGAAAYGGLPPWIEPRGDGDQAGQSRPLTVSIVAALLLLLAMIHSVGALGSFSLGLGNQGVGRAVVVGVLALVIGIGETVCAVQVTRGRAWARLAAGSMVGLMLIWLTMAPWSPGLLTAMVFAAWLAIGALLVHPLTSRFFAATAPTRQAWSEPGGLLESPNAQGIAPLQEDSSAA
ncbi:MAG: hypothetical protein LBJ62_03725 [Bifidobacteriaceae bacterium]|nr:hypothetical protein [Bifidobacteriaceae bacterium]